MRGIVLASLISLTGCVTAGSPDDADPTAPADPTNPTNPTNPTDPTDPEPPAPTADGTYQVRSQYDVTVDALLPEPAFELVGTLRAFSTAPAKTLLDVAEDAGVPAVGTIRDALPSSLESRLEGWIDEQIAKVTIDGVPVTQIAAEIAALGETALTQLVLDSELELDGSTATHTLTTIEISGTRIALADLPATITTKTTSCTVDQASLVIGEHAYALPYGQYVWAAVEAQVVSQYGKTPRALLGDAIDCSAIASAVANKCIFSVCVGHQAELTEICEQGLDEVVAVAQRKIEALKFDALRHAAGTATLADTDGDNRFDRMTGGVWTAQINASQGLRPVPATFTATAR